MAYIRRESDVNNRPFTDCGYKYRVSVRLVSVRVCWRESAAAAAAVACAVTGQPASERSAVLPGCWHRSNMSASNTSYNVPGVNLLVVRDLGAARLFLSRSLVGSLYISTPVLVDHFLHHGFFIKQQWCRKDYIRT